MIKGSKQNEETKRIISLKLKGRKLSLETRNKIRIAVKKRWEDVDYKKIVGKSISNALKGRIISEAWKEKMRLNHVGMKGKHQSLEAKKKLSEFNKGKKLSEDHKKKISESLMGRKLSEETKHKISLSKIGKSFSQKTRRKLSKSIKKRIKNGECKKFLEWSHKGKYFGIEISNLNYKELTPEKAYILGVLCGDGNINRCQLTLGVIDKDFVEYFIDCIKRVYGKNLKIKEETNKDKTYIKGVMIKNKKKIFKTILSSVKICSDLLRYDYTSTNFNSHTLRIPQEIINNKNKKVISMFLKGYYDSEGSIFGDISKRMIVLSSCNRNLLLDTQKLLKRFNIVSSIYSGRRKENEYKLSFSKNLFLLIFYKQIGFSIKRKQERLESNMNSIAKYFKVYNKIKKLNKKYSWSTTTLRTYFDNKLSPHYFDNWINGGNSPYNRFCVKTAIKLFP